MRHHVPIDPIRESLQPAPEAPACVFDERTSRRRTVIEPAHREVRFELARPEVPGRLAAGLQVATADFRRMVFSHRVPEGEAGRLLVVSQDVRDAKSVAPDFDAVRHRTLALQRRAAPEEQRCASGCDESSRGRRRAHQKRRYF
jgi:hypothetical protein